MAALGPAGAALADDWGRRHGALVEDVASGRAPWRPNTALRGAALEDALAAAELSCPPDAFAALAAVDARLRPWPDSSAALRALSGSFTVVALSNGTLAELTALSRAGGLLWHALLSAELVEAYKPDPAVYRFALERLALEPERTLMVAAHPWDLRGAAGLGVRTAYVARPGEDAPAADDSFDLYAGDLADLARQLVR